MPHAQRTITVNAPRHAVFAFFASPENDMRWRPAVKEIHAEGAPEVGTVIRQAISGPMGRAVSADIEVTACEPDTRYAFRAIAGPVRPVGSYELEDVEGGTKVTFTLTAEVSGVKKLLMAGSVQKSMDAEMACLDTAKSLIEGSP